MTEYNLFCYSTNYNDNNSFQQKRYRVFNKEVGEKRYEEILKTIKSILPPQNISLDSYWKSITQKQWQQLLNIPEGADFKEGFEYISSCKIEEQMPNLSGSYVEVIVNGKSYKAIIQ